MENHLAIKNQDIMNFADKLMELENIILSELTLIQKTHIYVLTYKWILSMKYRNHRPKEAKQKGKPSEES